MLLKAGKAVYWKEDGSDVMNHLSEDSNRELKHGIIAEN